MAQLKSGSTVGGSEIVTKGDNQALHDTDALRISGSTLYLYKGDGGNESVALPSSAPTTAQVGSATAGLTTGSVGSYALLGRVVAKNTTIATPGTVVSGSTLKYAQTSNVPGSTGLLYSTGPSGSWRCCGYLRNIQQTYSYEVLTLWLRIA